MYDEMLNEVFEKMGYVDETKIKYPVTLLGNNFKIEDGIFKFYNVDGQVLYKYEPITFDNGTKKGLVNLDGSYIIFTSNEIIAVEKTLEIK